jgi:hypothetical protein
MEEVNQAVRENRIEILTCGCGMIIVIAERNEDINQIVVYENSKLRHAKGVL